MVAAHGIVHELVNGAVNVGLIVDTLGSLLSWLYKVDVPALCLLHLL